MVWMTSRRAAILAALASVLTCKDAAAVLPLIPDEASRDKAADLRRQASALARKGDLDGALAAYKRALALDTIACGTSANLGALELQMGKHRDAAEHLSLAIKFCDGGVKNTLTEKLAQAKTHVGTLKINVENGQVIVKLDDHQVDWFDFDAVYVDPGVHSVAVSRQTLTVTVGAGDQVEVHFPPSPPALRLPKPQAPATAYPETQAAAPERDKSLWLLIGGAGVASTGIALGAGFTLKANGDFSQGTAARNAVVATSGPAACSAPIPQNVAACANLHGVWQDHDTSTNVAMWSFILGGAVAAGTITYAIWPGSSEPKAGTTARVTPLITPYGGSILVATQF
jgi:tetratricopeptide (TPR) repeat protein